MRNGDPTDSGSLQQLLLANWCLKVGGAVQLLPLLQLQNFFLSNSNTTLHDFVLLMNLFCNSHRTYNTVAKETFLPQQLKKLKCTPIYIYLFDII